MATITGTSGNDTLRGTSNNDRLSGLSGNDTLFGSAGTDVLDGGEGSDTVNYSPLGGAVQLDLAAGTASKSAGGVDTIISIGNAVGTGFADSMIGNANQNILQAGNGNDALVGGAGNDTLDGGEGSDLVSYAGSPAGVNVDLARGSAQDGFGGTDRITSVGLARGSEHADTLSGNANSNTLEGGGGADRLFGMDGDDVLLGGAGSDHLDGGNGNDTVSYFNDSGSVSVNLLTGTATDGTGGRDTILSCGHVIGTPDGADTLIGNNNVNIINGIGGQNRLTGNGGADTFVMNSWDWWGSTITDFEHAIDKLSVSLASTPVTGASPGPLAASRFTTGTPTSSQWTFLYDRSTGEVAFDIDGNGPDGAIHVATISNHPVLTSTDFVLA